MAGRYPVHEAGEYMDLLERYLEKLPLTVRRGRRPGDENRFLLEGQRRSRLPCGEAKLLVYGNGYMRFEYMVRIAALKENKDLLLSAINGLNLSGAGGLSFYLAEDSGRWLLAADARLQMDSCNCASARREAYEVLERMYHVNDALNILMRQLPEFFGEDAGEKAQEKSAASGNSFGLCGAEAFDFAGSGEGAFVGDAETGAYDGGESFPEGDGPIVPEAEVDGLLERFERDGIDSLSGSELLRLHIGLLDRLEEKKNAFELLQQAMRAPAPDAEAAGESGEKPVRNIPLSPRKR